MKTENGQTRLQFVAYLRHTRIPDFIAADMSATAEDFETALQFLCDDVEAMHDARKALLAASAHTPAGSNAATLCANATTELGEILGKNLAPATPEPVRFAKRPLDCRSTLHD